ncbi:MAG: hypothetical protein JF606_27535 [Burkholderiales bacterium]|jgi:hypothetical protein|nr:hypothetical protein [Burkholderiales bacterium]
MCAFVRPAHLALLGHARAHQLIDRRFRRRAADGQASAVAPAVVDQIAFVGLEVGQQVVDVPQERPAVDIVGGAVLGYDPIKSNALIATRYEKLARNLLSLVCAYIWLA